MLPDHKKYFSKLQSELTSEEFDTINAKLIQTSMSPVVTLTQDTIPQIEGAVIRTAIEEIENNERINFQYANKYLRDLVNHGLIPGLEGTLGNEPGSPVIGNYLLRYLREPLSDIAKVFEKLFKL